MDGGMFKELWGKLDEVQRQEIRFRVSQSAKDFAKQKDFDYADKYPIQLNIAFNQDEPPKYVFVSGWVQVEKKKVGEKEEDFARWLLDYIEITEDANTFLDNADKINAQDGQPNVLVKDTIYKSKEDEKREN